MKSKFFSIIPARIGSKGIPKKNLYPLLGKPLIQWTLESSANSDYILKTVVSSDSDEILSLGELFGAITHKRSNMLSNDDARTEAVVENIFEELNFLKDKFDYFVLLQPTSPLRTSEHINLACKKILDSKSESLMSVKEIPNGVLKTLISDDRGGLKAGFNKDFPFTPRQELPQTYMPNGAIYISKISSFIKNKSLLSENNSFIIMDEVSSYDIDKAEDIKRVNYALEKNDNNKKS
jgi:CMP-N-acetylneuraminic acid synthetase